MRVSYIVILSFLLCTQPWFMDCLGKNGNRIRKAMGRCVLSIPQRTSRQCQITRERELAKERQFYKMTGPRDRFPFPHLDHSINATIKHFITEKFHASWSKLYMKVGQTARSQTARKMVQKYATTSFISYGNYTQLGNNFEEAFLAATSPYKQFKYASRSYKFFIDLGKNERFMQDDYFAQLRLGGVNPTGIRRVTIECDSGTNYFDLLDRLNTNFDWEYAVTSITEDEDIQESVEKNKVYVLEYPGLEGITNMPDYLAKYNPGRTMRNNSAQIALFAVDPQRRLRVVAIQNSTTKAGHVFTPRDGLKWTLAKADLQINDVFYSANIGHLLKSHFKMEPVCISMHRHLSKLHPLYQIFQYHCRGVIPLTAIGIESLLKSANTFKSLFSYGNEGAVQLLRKEYPKMVWHDVDLEWSIQERGMDDKEHIPYYPYRDDGRLINRVLQKFANRLINLYYHRDYHVYHDYELQNMIGELSQRKGSKNANNISKVKGLPSNFWTRRQLKTFVRQLLWIVVHHSMFSYPTADYFIPPIYAAKLYDSQKNPKDVKFAEMLPGPLHTILQSSLGSAVGTLRYDSMFDYWKYLKTGKLRFLVKRAYKEILIAQRQIAKMNRRRYQRGLITNPYVMKGWLTSSICT